MDSSKKKSGSNLNIFNSLKEIKKQGSQKSNPVRQSSKAKLDNVMKKLKLQKASSGPFKTMRRLSEVNRSSIEAAETQEKTPTLIRGKSSTKLNIGKMKS